VKESPLEIPTNERPGPGRAVLALLVALVSDGLSVWVELVPPLQIGLDLVTAGLLFAILGFRWPFLPSLVVEAVPGLALFPTWTLVVGAMSVLGPRRTKTQEREQSPELGSGEPREE